MDTYRGDKNDPDTLHLYSYCANNPINYTDPTGHKKYKKNKTFKYKKFGILIAKAKCNVTWETKKNKKNKKGSCSIKVTPGAGFIKRGTPWKFMYYDNSWSPARGEAMFAFSVEAILAKIITIIPVPLNYYPHAWYYGDGGIDWTKNNKV